MAQKTPKDEEAADDNDAGIPATGGETTLEAMAREAEETIARNRVRIVKREELLPPSQDDLIKIQVIAGLAYLAKIDIVTSSQLVEGLVAESSPFRD